MIGSLHGTVMSIDASTALIDVQGIGFECRMPQGELTTMHIGDDVVVQTVLNISQDAVTLFGFTSQSSKRMFLQLQKVSGVGPKVALSLLSTLPPDSLMQAIHDENATALAKAPGLGKKGAQKIILELKGSIDLSTQEQARSTSTVHQPEDTNMMQVVEGLVSLGWKYQDAYDAVRHVMREHHLTPPIANDMVPQLLRMTLTSLDRGR